MDENANSARSRKPRERPSWALIALYLLSLNAAAAALQLNALFPL